MATARALTPDAALVAARAPELSFYSPYFFLRTLSAEAQQRLFGTGAATRFGDGADEEVLEFGAGATQSQWLLQHLPWDSEYFSTPTYRLFTGLFGPATAPAALRAAATAVREQLAARGQCYAFSVVPAQDLPLLQALTGAGWQLVETRLTYYCDTVAHFDHPRFPVRAAQPAEAALVGAVAAAAANPYDRYHADPWFGPARADAYLARYAEAAVQGQVAAAVLVPAEPGLPLDSFLAIADYPAHAAALGQPGGLSRVLLTAVGPQNRGWHVRLVSETVYRARELGHHAVLMTTQATNGAVFRTSEKLGFRLGATSHVLACHS